MDVVRHQLTGHSAAEPRASGPRLVPAHPAARRLDRSAARPFAAALVVLIAANACRQGHADPGDRRPAAAVAVGVDSAVSREEALRRFRASVAPVTSLSSGATSLVDLTRAVVSAAGARDTTKLRDLVVTRAEFAWLYYPTAAQGLPPYDLSPQLLWFLSVGGSEKGLGQLIDVLGDRAVTYAGHRCDPPRYEGANTLWGPCVVRVAVPPADTAEARLFGLVLERGGRFKVLSFANTL
jgi:hypothetical protein